MCYINPLETNVPTKYKQFLINFAREKRSQLDVLSSSSKPQRSQNGNIMKQSEAKFEKRKLFMFLLW